MQWFDKHLNLMAVVMALGSAGLFFLFIWLSFGIGFPDWHNIVALSTPTLILLLLLVISWLFLNALGYVWILYRKQRSYLFVILILPELIAVVGCIVYKLFWFSTVRVWDISIRIMQDSCQDSFSRMRSHSGKPHGHYRTKIPGEKGNRIRGAE